MKQGTDPLGHGIDLLVDTLQQLLLAQPLGVNNHPLTVMRLLFLVLPYISEESFLHRAYIEDCFPVIDNAINSSCAHCTFVHHITTGLIFRHLMNNLNELFVY